MFILKSTLTLLATAATLALVDAQSWPLNPTVGQTINGLRYEGCADEIPGRALPSMSYSDDKMTITSCQEFCNKNNFQMSGVEYGRECFCGKFLWPPNKLGQTGCNMPCKGNTGQTCGGNARISIFNSTKFAMPTAATGLGTWKYASCYMEPMWGRILTTLIKADDQMTVNMCTSSYQNAGFLYAGLEYGRECWCGKTKSDKLQDASDPFCEMQCDMICGGDNRQICGGRATLSLYKNSAKKRDEVEDAAALGKRKGRFVKVRRSAPKNEAVQEV